MSLQTKALLTRVVVNRWGASRSDKRIADQIDQLHNAVNGGRYTKSLIPKEHTKAYQTSGGAIRTLNYKLTLPWDDAGDRILPAKLLQKYQDGMRDLKNQDSQICQVFFNMYPQLLAEAPLRLGTLFDASDYPHPQDLPNLFDVKIFQKNIPAAADFRVDINDEAARKIREDIEADNQARLNGAVKDVYKRVQEVVARIATTMKEEDPRIFDTMVTNARDLVECLPGLNITDDPLLQQLGDDLESMLPASSKALKHNPDLRKRMADDADEILNKMTGYV